MSSHRTEQPAIWTSGGQLAVARLGSPGAAPLAARGEPGGAFARGECRSTCQGLVGFAVEAPSTVFGWRARIRSGPTGDG